MKRLCCIAAVFCVVLGQSAQGARKKKIEGVLESTRVEHGVPALAAAVIKSNKLHAFGAVGVRKLGSDVKVTKHDLFHLGSCTKAITGTVIGVLVEKGKLRWNSRLSDIFPALVEEMHSAYRDVTVEDILAHRAGLPSRTETWPRGKSYRDMHSLAGTRQEQRLAYTRMILKEPPSISPKTTYVYSNSGYAILGAIAETAVDIPYEELVAKAIFKPLRMRTAGFGPMGLPEKIVQPWQHRYKEGRFVPIEPIRYNDNPPVMNPAGTIHLSMADWSKFVLAHLTRGRRTARILSFNGFKRLHTPMLGGDYAAGWRICERKWGRGSVLAHSGTNGKNYAVVWVAPKRDFAVMVATNAGGEKASKACKQAVVSLMKMYL